MTELDATDRKILTILERDGRIAMLELAARVGLSPTPCGRRVKRLEETGMIMGYGARINPVALGRMIEVLISVRLARHGPEGSEHFRAAMALRPEVTECLLVTGNVDYMLRISVADIDALARFIRDVLQAIPMVAETGTMVVLERCTT